MGAMSTLVIRVFWTLAAVAYTTGLVTGAAPARAEVTRVVISASAPLGIYGGRQYIWANGHFEGVVSRADGTTGSYRVPISLYYPDRAPNGFGFVDVVNVAQFYAFPPDM